MRPGPWCFIRLVYDCSLSRIPSRVAPPPAAFKTDTDISQKAVPRRERELQAWQSDNAEFNGAAAQAGAPNTRNVDELTFGAGSGGTWDQFATNEKLFGITANFDEDAYTTRLDRNAPDFKERERKAQQLANEIMNVSLKRDPDVGLDRISDKEHVTRTFRHAMHTRSPLRPTPTLPRSVL